jgi:pimeloyl-ACP methyl ester carboxylesterase
VAKLPAKDVVVLLPGILGSVLQRDGKDVWAMSKGALLRGLLSLGGSVKDLALDGDDPEQDDLGDGVTAPRLMPDLHLVPGLWKIDGYTKVRERLLDTFDFTVGKNWFDFPYDWRRDNRVAGRHLAERAPQWLKAWRDESGADDAKLVLVGHSMGGLVARAYLELFDGWKDTRALITFGTPYRGAMNALDFLNHGLSKGVGPLKLDLTPFLRSLTSVYQLLPIYESVDPGDSTLRRITELDPLPVGVDRERAVAALEFHRSIERAVDANGGLGRYDIHPVVGIFQPTRTSALLRDGVVETQMTYLGEDEGGDGTVPRASATPIELGDQPVGSFATESHASLQNVDSVLTQVMGILSWKKTGLRKATPFDGFSLDLDDAVAADEAIAFTARTAGPSNEIEVTAIDADTDIEAARQRVARNADGDFTGSLPGLAPGVYRVRLADASEAGLVPVHDLLTVVSGDETVEGVAPEG